MKLAYRYDAPNAPGEISEAAAALSLAEVDLDALPWVAFDLAAGTAQAHAGYADGDPVGPSSAVVSVPGWPQ